MRTFAPMAVGVFAIIASIFSSNIVSAAPQKTSTKHASPFQAVYTVKAGDTLSKIGEIYKLEYPRIFDANLQIANADMIDVGDKIKIPKASAKFASRIISQPVAVSYAHPASYVNYTYTSQRSAVPVRTASGNVWDQIAQCESGGNWSINTGNGYTGGLQFAPGTWGGYKGYASAAAAPKSIQIERAEQVRAAHGGSYGSWPACSARLGLN